MTVPIGIARLAAISLQVSSSTSLSRITSWYGGQAAERREHVLVGQVIGNRRHECHRAGEPIVETVDDRRPLLARRRLLRRCCRIEISRRGNSCLASPHRDARGKRAVPGRAGSIS